MELLDEKQAAKYLGVQPNTLSVWRSKQKYPLSFIRVGALIRYTREALDSFLASRTVTPGEAKPKRRRSRRRAAK